MVKSYKKFHLRTSKFLSVILIISLILCGAYLYYLQKETELSFKIGKFTISTNSNEIYSTEENGKKIQPYISKIGEGLAPDCPKVSGVETILLRRKLENIEKEQSPVYIATSWNFDELSFVNEDSQNHASNVDKALSNLDSYTNTDKLKQLVFSNHFDPNSRNNPLPISTSPWRGLDSCGGYFSYPIYIQLVEQDKFDKVIYAESIEGQDVTTPSKILIVKENNNWLIFKEEGSSKEELFFKDAEICNTRKGNNLWRCYEEMWSKKYRLEVENQQWIDQVMDIINYPASN